MALSRKLEIEEGEFVTPQTHIGNKNRTNRLIKMVMGTKSYIGYLLDETGFYK